MAEEVVDRQRFLQLFHEFGKELETVHALYLDSVVGYSLMHSRVQERQMKIRSFIGDSELAAEDFQDTCSVSYECISGDTFQVMSLYPNMKQGDVKKRTEKDGHNILRLGERCVVQLCAYWEEYLILEIGIAKGALPVGASRSKETSEVLNRTVKYDVWGDLRLFRNSIVHNVGRASSDIDKCRMFVWFRPGDKIDLNYDRMRQIFRALAVFRNDLHGYSLPPHRPTLIR